MAFGLPPKFVQDFNFGNSDKEHFLVIAIETAFRLGWGVDFVSENGFIAYTKISWSSWGEEITVKISNGTVNIKSECIGSQIIDMDKNKKNVNMLITTIERLQLVFTQEEIETKLTELRQVYVPKEEDILSKPPATVKEKITDFFSFFKPEKEYFISPILININILVFIVMLISGVHFLLPENQDLISWGANFRPLTLEGQWWRLFTSCFVHIGVVHLLLNMYALLYAGLLLESYLGRTRFLAAYLISGIAASVTSLWWHDLTISAGASGAIFGMYGVLLALLTTDLPDKSFRTSQLISIAVFVGYNILYGLRFNIGIDNAAHIGGLLSGLVVGYAFVPSLKNYNHSALKFSTIAVLTVVLLISSFFVYTTLPNDIVEYDEKMNEFISMETMALEIYTLPEGTSNEKVLYELKNKGIFYWNESIKLIESCKYLNLPLSIRERNNKLKEYCELRIKVYELIYKAIEENTEQYQSEIDEYNQKVEAVIAELSNIP